MDELLVKLACGMIPSKKDVISALHEVCDSVHSSCGNECPVYRLNGGIPWNKEFSNCVCFKDGFKMAKFIRVKKGIAGPL